MKGSDTSAATTAAPARKLVWEDETVRFEVTRKERDFIMRAARRMGVHLGRAVYIVASEFPAGGAKCSLSAPALAEGKRQPIKCWIDPDDVEAVQNALWVARRRGIDDEVESLIAFFEDNELPPPMMGPSSVPLGGPERASIGGGETNPCHQFLEGDSTSRDTSSRSSGMTLTGPSPRRPEDQRSRPARARSVGDTPSGGEVALLLSRPSKNGVVGYGLPESVADFAAKLDASEKELHSLCRAAVWCRSTLPKRDGGTRPITIPLKRLRNLQKKIARLIAPLVYSSLNYCRKGLSVKKCDEQHVGAACVGHLDIANFFGSVSEEQVELALSRRGLHETAVLRLVIELTCFEGSLPQGSPASNILADLVFASVDLRIREAARILGVTVTRWVDGYVVSGQRRAVIREMLDLIAREIGKIGLSENKSKRWVLTSQQARVHGLRVQRRVRLSKAEKKRIASELRRVERYGCDTKRYRSLKGKIARVREHEPERAGKLERRFARIESS